MQYRELSDQDLAKVIGGVSASSYSTSTSSAPLHGSKTNQPVAPVHHVTPILPISSNTYGKLFTLPSR